ncbi:MAG: OmpA family protein [Candidatus Kapabacteria bacterium]|nr:OmpA family protein [Ignavibacteria bacterium]MBP6509681.1 OmpA family protein [Candidatus Kapabacteria bacterium]
MTRHAVIPSYRHNVIKSLRHSVILAILLLGGCASWQEPEATADATPPPGYAPIFLRTVAPLPEKKPQKAALTATRVDTRDGKTVKIYAHVLDSNGTYYTGGVKGNGKALWCKVTETINGTTREVKNYTIREVTERDKEPIAVALVMDNSGSMGDARARAMQASVEDFLGLKQPQDAVALVRYDHHTEVESALSSNTDEVRARLKQNGLEGFGGGTAIHSGVAAAIEHLDATAPKGTRKAVIIFTDGQENSSKISRDEMISRAIKSNIVVCAVDFGAGINEGYMEDIARSTGGSYSHIYGTAEFRPMFEDVYRRLKNSYVIEYPVQDYGPHDVKLKLCWGKDTASSTFHYDNTPDVGAIALLNVNFDHGKATLDASSSVAINNIVTMMKALPKMTIEVRGHTDNTNSTTDPDFNKKLSQKRAEAVRDAIVRGGIKAERIAVKGYGDSEPVASNDTEEGRAQNRRTEFISLTR